MSGKEVYAIFGYSDMGYEEDGSIDPYPEWWILMQNFDEPAPYPTDEYQVILGGLGEIYSGTLWETSFAWVNTESQTNHGLIDISSTLPPNPCPRISTQPVEEPIDTEAGRSFYFVGQPNSTYYVYRSQLGSGANNGASNGRYYYIGIEVSNDDGIGIYTDFDVYDGPSWYLVIQADPGTGAIIGCHSEEGDPTNVVMGEFTANYDEEKSAVVLEWETVNETNIVGFDVFRGITDTLVDSVKINTEIITAKQSGSPVGDIYTFEDTDIEGGQTYYYWIEILTNDMSDQTVGPESVTIPEPAWFYYFLPLLFN